MSVLLNFKNTSTSKCLSGTLFHSRSGYVRVFYVHNFLFPVLLIFLLFFQNTSNAWLGFANVRYRAIYNRNVETSCKCISTCKLRVSSFRDFKTRVLTFLKLAMKWINDQLPIRIKSVLVA